jgi:hypothetical protein
LERLLEPDVADAYRAAISDEVVGWQSTVEGELSRLDSIASFGEARQLVNTVERTVVGGILAVARRVLGVKTAPAIRQQQLLKLRSPAYIVARDRLRAAHAALRGRFEYEEAGPLRAEIAAAFEAKKTATVAELRVRYAGWRDRLGRMPLPDFWKVMRRMGRKRSSAAGALPSHATAMAAYRQHYSQQFTNNHIPGPESMQWTPPTRVGAAAASHAQWLDTAFDDATVQAVLQSLPRGKAAGASGLPNDLLAPISADLAPLMALVFKLYAFLGVVPTAWSRAIIIPVPKAGDLSNIANHRPISLTEVTRKAFEMCVQRWLATKVQLSPEQGGFRARRSTLDQVQALHESIRAIRRRCQRAPAMAFLDIKAAYDSVPRSLLWERCGVLGLGTRVVSVLQALFDHNSSCVLVNGCFSKDLGHAAGVLQGSVLSPLLYAIFLDPLVAKVKAEQRGVAASHGVLPTCLLYADDIALLARSNKDLAALLRACEADSLERGYRFSIPKSVVLAPGSEQLSLYGESLGRVEVFKYLGISINGKGIAEADHVASRILKAAKQSDAIARLALPPCLSMRAFKVLIRPGLEYGLPLLQRKGAVAQLQTTQLRILRRLLHFRQSSALSVVSAVSNCPPLQIRGAVLRIGRAHRLAGCLVADDSDDFMLVRTLRAVSGPEYFVPIDPRSRVNFLAEEHFAPLDRSLRGLTNGPVSVALLTRLVRLPMEFPMFHSLVLWLMDHWRSFPGRSCHRCGEPAPRQQHILECGGLAEALLTLPACSRMPLTTVNPASVFHLITEIIARPVSSLEQATMIAAVAHSLRLAVATVTGCTLH